jgi:hypothetical protein
MKPKWKNGKLTVELHVPDEKALEKAREIGLALVAMNQETGKPLVEAVDAILKESQSDQ